MASLTQKIPAITDPATEEPMCKTGKYLHRPEDIAFISFDTLDDAPRVFAAVKALGRQAPEAPEHIDFSVNGVAIIDVDNRNVVADRICHKEDAAALGDLAGPDGHGPRHQNFVFTMIATMPDKRDWKSFASFCCNLETFRSQAPDLACTPLPSLPDPGNRPVQEHFGLLDPLDRDLRCDILRGLHAADDVPYSFPRRNRDQMVADIIGHHHYANEQGVHIAWDIRMKGKWDRSAAPENMRDPSVAEDVDRNLETDWLAHLDDNPELIIEAGREAMRPYVDAPFNPLDCENTTCKLEMSGQRNSHIILTRMNDHALSHPDIDSLRDALDGMPDEDLKSLWMTVRTLDDDLSYDNRVADVQFVLNEWRAAWETEQHMDMRDTMAI